MRTFKKGDQIIYVPTHADGIDHPDAERGFVTGLCPNEDSVFCRYWSKTNPHQLRTTANSEATPINMLVKDNSRLQSTITQLLKGFGY